MEIGASPIYEIIL